jgi:hypothetical protein
VDKSDKQTDDLEYLVALVKLTDFNDKTSVWKCSKKCGGCRLLMSVYKGIHCNSIYKINIEGVKVDMKYIFPLLVTPPPTVSQCILSTTSSSKRVSLQQGKVVIARIVIIRRITNCKVHPHLIDC